MNKTTINYTIQDSTQPRQLLASPEDTLQEVVLRILGDELKGSYASENDREWHVFGQGDEEVLPEDMSVEDAFARTRGRIHLSKAKGVALEIHYNGRKEVVTFGPAKMLDAAKELFCQKFGISSTDADKVSFQSRDPKKQVTHHEISIGCFLALGASGALIELKMDLIPDKAIQG